MAKKNGAKKDVASLNRRIKAFQIARRFASVVWTVGVVFLGLMLFGAISSGLKDIKRHQKFYRAVEIETAVERPFRMFLHTHFPTDFNGRDITGTLLVVAALGLVVLIGDLGESCSKRIEILEGLRDEDSGDLLRHAVKLRSGTLDRAELLQLYAETKKSLEDQKQLLSFLSIDVVDSTGMKVGEDPGVAEHDFRKYKTLVQKAIQLNMAIKSAWTPDGVMICFRGTRDAVKAAQKILADVATFNRAEKAMKRDFRLRIGINTGEVFTDDAIPMAEMTDRVIDIAGHMQKHGGIDAIAISRHSIEPLLGEFAFQPVDRVVDGCPVYEWRLSTEKPA